MNARDGDQGDSILVHKTSNGRWHLVASGLSAVFLEPGDQSCTASVDAACNFQRRALGVVRNPVQVGAVRLNVGAAVYERLRHVNIVAARCPVQRRFLMPESLSTAI